MIESRYFLVTDDDTYVAGFDTKNTQQKKRIEEKAEDLGHKIEEVESASDLSDADIVWDESY